MTENNFPLAEVFRDAKKHREVSGIISKHLVNKQDIRELALRGIDLSNKMKILDLGCGFGFFSEALQNRLNTESIVTGIDKYPELEWFYLQSCDKANLNARFLSNGSQVISEMEDNSVDLVLSSYALYFFPDIISQISRVLKSDGLLIAITHACPHMEEFTSYIRRILLEDGIKINASLPYEKLIERFCNKNGKRLLEASFKDISTIRYNNKLVFGKNDFKELSTYFDFKHSFFIPKEIDPDDSIHHKVVSRIKYDLKHNNILEITKNDIIFKCSNPL